MTMSLILFILFLSPVIAQIDLNILIFTEVGDDGVKQQLAEGLKLAEDKYRSKLKINDVFVPLLRNQEEVSYNRACSELGKGVNVILDLSWAGWYKAKQISEMAGLPYLRVDVTISNFVKAVDSFLMKRNGTDAALIFETEQELDQALYYMIGNSILRVIVLNKLDERNVRGLIDMRPTPSFHVIFGTTQTIDQLYKIAVDNKLVKRGGRWNLVFTDFKFDDFRKDDVTVLTNFLTLNKDVCCRLLNMNNGCACPSNFKIIPNFLKTFGQFLGDVFNHMLGKGLSLDKITGDCATLSASTADNTTVNMFYETVSKLVSSDLALGYEDEERNMFYKSEMDIEVADKNGSNKLAKWTTETGFVYNEGKELERDKRFFRIGVLPDIEPWSWQVKDPATNEMKWVGYCIDLTEKLSELMNFEYEFSVPKSGTYGERIGNTNKWDGLVGDLSRGQTDIVVAPLTMTSEREEVIDFVAPYFDQSGISIMIRKPERPTSLFKFMTVLRTEVWVSIVAALTITGFMIWILDRFSPYSARNNKDNYPYPCREFTLKESFWFALTSFTPQGGGEAPKALSGRTLVAAYWLFVVLMLATFTANLAAFLTVERMKSPVESLEQLARQSRINYTVVENEEAHLFFINMKKAEDTLYRQWKELTLNATSDQTEYRVWDYPIKEQYGHILLAMSTTGFLENETVGVEKVLESKDGEFAFIHDSASVKYQVYKNCNLTEVGEVFAERPYAVAVQQGSQLQEEISRRILDLQKDRYFETQSSKYWNSSAAGTCPNTDDSEGITLESLGGVFIATLFGLALAMITLAFEIFYHKRKDEIDAKFSKFKIGKIGKLKSKKINQKDESNTFQSKVLNGPRGGITLGAKDFGQIKPTHPGRVSYISVFPRNPQPYD